MNVLIERLKRHAELSKPEGIAYDCERAAALITELYDALREVAEFIVGQVDVVDGDYGQPRPNRAMQLMQTIESVLREEDA